MATRGSFYPRRRTRVYVPPRASRTEGDFPVLSTASKSQIRDVIDIDEPVAPIYSSIRVKPHLLKSDEPRRLGPSPIATSSNPPSMSDSSSTVPPEIKQLDSESLLTDLKGKKFRWLPNPFLPNNDLRQGGPLFYSKHFTDRDRIMDEKIVQEVLDSSRDTVATAKSKTERGRRSKAFWSQYRPLAISAIQAIPSLDKLVKILGNEVHLVKKSQLGCQSPSIVALEGRFRELLEDLSDPMTKDSLVSMVKCMHYFGVYGELSDFQHVNQIMDLLAHPDSRKYLKPVNYIYAIQAMARFNYRDHRLIKLVDFLALSWGTVGVKEPLMLIRGANALAKLDLISATPLTNNLKEALGELIPKLTVSQLEKIKAITIIELFDELMILDYLVMCFEKKIHYKRHMILVYLYHRNKSGVMSKIPDHVKEWIQETIKESCSIDDEPSTSSSSSSDLHRNIEVVLEKKFPTIQITSGQKFGPLTLDLFIPSLNTAIEACSEFQFYHRTSKLTSEARLRHELIRSFGIKLVPIYHFNWSPMTDEQKFKKLHSVIHS